jgi:thiol-disulfide isomerase/thioredoxin
MSFACALLVAFLGGSLSVGRAGPAASKVDPKSRELLDGVIAAYKALPAYRDQGEFQLAIAVNGTAKSQNVPLHVTFVRPNRLNLDTGLTRAVCDGKTLTIVIVPLQKYTSAPAPATIDFDTVFTGGSLGSALFGGPSAPLMLILMNLLLAPDPAKGVLDLGESLTTEKDIELDGKTCRVLKVGSETGPSFLLMIDPETKLLRGIDLTFDPKALADSFPKGQEIKVDRYRWTAGTVSTKPAELEAFAFTAPAGFTKVDSLAPAGGGGGGDEPDQKFKIHDLIGKPAPDFTLTVLDGEGKTRSVSKADLAGKVVMIDFWATWCGPCLQELPEVQKLIEAYGKAKRDVVIVALSQDNDPKDPLEVRKLIESTLEKKKIVLDSTLVGKIALDPSTTIGDAFKVEGFPTVVLLDAKGIVRSAHVGFSPGVGAKLTKEIDALLEGKPIGKENVEKK